VTRIKEFYGWVNKKVKKKSNHKDLDNGILYLKGGDLEEEFNELKHPYQIIDLSTYFTEEFFETKKVVYVPL
jgi:16S rRNA (guanine527-N7)-methyltransferase